MAKKTVKATPEKKYISQLDVPRVPLEQALKVSQAIYENYAMKPTTPLNVAQAMNMQPNSSHFRMICGASISYGLTKGGYNAAIISVETLAKRILTPLNEEDDFKAKREAFLKPNIIGNFLHKYNTSQIPRQEIAENIITEMGVPKERAKSVLDIIIGGAESLSMIKEIKGKKYIDIENDSFENNTQNNSISDEENNENENNDWEEENDKKDNVKKNENVRSKKVFITHGKNKSFLEPIKRLLIYGELEPVISVEKQSVSQPVTDKVMNDMRICGAAIIHVDADEKLTDKNAVEHVIINPNVLIEIGAALALFGRRFILLVKDGVKLPSNLQGLYEVRYSNDILDGETTIRLLEAINEMKKQSHPN